MIIANFWLRLILAFQVFKKPFTYKIKIGDNYYDLSNNTIYLDEFNIHAGKVTIHSRNSMDLTSDKHVRISSGRTQVPGKSVQYSICENCEFDPDGDPLVEEV